MKNFLLRRIIGLIILLIVTSACASPPVIPTLPDNPPDAPGFCHGMGTAPVNGSCLPTDTSTAPAAEVGAAADLTYDCSSYVRGQVTTCLA